MFGWLLAIVYAIWRFFSPYCTARIEEIGIPEDAEEENEPVYDYIIVGGDTAIPYFLICRRHSGMRFG